MDFERTPKLEQVTAVSVVRRNALLLSPGKKVQMPRHAIFTPEFVTQAIAGFSKKNGPRYEVGEHDGCVTITRIDPDPTRKPGMPSIETQLREIQPGHSALVEGATIRTIRSLASLLKRHGVGVFSVSATGPYQAMVSRLPDGASATREKFPFSAQHPGSEFTVPADLHTGIENMQLMCSRRGTALGMAFVAQLNVDNSITVLCFAQGGMPPRWKLMKDFDKRQEAIKVKQGNDS